LTTGLGFHKDRALDLPQQILLILIAVPAAIFDLRSRRIPNWLTLPAIVIAFAVNRSLASLEGFALALAVYGTLYALRAMGGGDVKLMAALGAAAAPMDWLKIFVLTALIGGIAAIITMVARKRVRQTLGNVGGILKGEKNPELDVKNPAALRLPHGAIIGIATLAYLITQF
jgi:prepilin peptidase CpaA